MTRSSEARLTVEDCQRRFHRFSSLHLTSLLRQYEVYSPFLPAWLAKRERSFGAATLPAQSLLLLLTLAEQYGVDSAHSIVSHEATVTAAQTQAVLSSTTVVQKTVCLEIVNRRGETPDLVVLTGLGNFALERGHRHVLADHLGYFHRAVKRAVLNPPWLDPVALFGMMPGMVSPFLAPEPPPPLAALAVLKTLPPSDMTHVAVSVSLFESLVLPIATFFPLLESYARLVLPRVRLLLLDHSSCPSEPLPAYHPALAQAAILTIS